MRKFFLAAAVATVLSGCAVSPTQFADSANNVVQDVNTSATSAVSIVTDIAKALLAVEQPVLSILSSAGINL